MKKITLSLLAVLTAGMVYAQDKHTDKFAQLDQELATPNVYRTASGAPGHMYWQQRADYTINVTLDDEKQRLTASETITYTNNSPDELTYLWVQLDQNRFKKDSDTYKTQPSSMNDKMSFGRAESLLPSTFDGGYKITAVKDANGKEMSHIINKTMMRIDLPAPLKTGESVSFSIDWNHNIVDQKKMGGRGGFEYFEEDGNYLYEIAQWFPRMCVYSDNNGWQNKQFLGRGEFALPFGDYTVNITVPADHVVAASGELQNMSELLTEKQIERFNKAKTAVDPIEIVTEKEARKAEKGKAKGTKTWTFKADDVRDFAWASSRKFIWDARGVKMENGKTVMAMSFYPKEGNPLWGQYSTEAVAHTLEVYSKYTIDYPYPVAISVHGPVWGMEYPMISFNGGRPEEDGTYSDRIKYAMISVIIHEVGHNFFPMIINSDERQWTWMDEGLNTFVQYLTEQEWDRDYPHRRGPAFKIVDYMKSSKETMRPIMTNSEAIPQFGSNAYAKPATALNILRETVMGRELFDYAFKEYARRWAFKHPTPEDLFRTMEDASGVDLDWFWRGWFYTTDNVDISIEDVNWYQPNTMNPVVENKIKREEFEANAKNISTERNRESIAQTKVEAHDDLRDFYNSYDQFEVTSDDKKAYQSFVKGLSQEEKELLSSGLNFYEISFRNNGGLVMPVIIEFTYEDGSTEVEHIPAEIWRMNNNEFTKVFAKEKKVVSFRLDPNRETADVDEENNFFPRRNIPTRFEMFKRKPWNGSNPMQKKSNATSRR